MPRDGRRLHFHQISGAITILHHVKGDEPNDPFTKSYAPVTFHARPNCRSRNADRNRNPVRWTYDSDATRSKRPRHTETNYCGQKREIIDFLPSRSVAQSQQNDEGTKTVLKKLAPLHSKSL